MSMYPALTEDPHSSTSGHGGAGGGGGGPSSASGPGSKRRPGDAEIDNGHNVPPKIDDDTEDAALTIEHLTFGRSRVAGGHSIPYFGARHPSSVGRKEPNNDYHLARTAHSSPGSQVPPTLHSHPSSPNHPHPHPHPHPHGHGHGPAPPAKRSSLNVEVKSEASAGPPHHHQGPGGGGGRRFIDTLSHEDRMARMDALLDIMEPTDLIDMFWRKTDVGVRYLMRIFPEAEKGRFLVNAVSRPYSLAWIVCLGQTSSC